MSFMASPYTQLKFPNSNAYRAFDDSFDIKTPSLSPERREHWSLWGSPVGTLGSKIGREILETRPPSLELDKSLGLDDLSPVTTPSRSTAGFKVTTIKTQFEFPGHLTGTSNSIPASTFTSPLPPASFHLAPQVGSLADDGTTTNDVLQENTRLLVLTGVNQTSVIGPTSSIQSQIISGPGSLPVDVGGFTLFPRPTTTADIVSMIIMRVPVINFVEHTHHTGGYHCHGRYYRDENQRWVLMSKPCTGVKNMSTYDIFERHVKRCHFEVKRELGNDLLNLMEWARECGYLLPQTGRRRPNSTYIINWDKAGVYVAPPPAI